MIRSNAKPIELPSTSPVATIQRVVAGSYGVTLDHLLSDRRSNAWPRQVAMYLARELTPKSLPCIGRIFHRDHTTVIWACKRVAERMADDPLIRADIEALATALMPVETVENSTISKSDDAFHGRTNREMKQGKLAA